MQHRQQGMTQEIAAAKSAISPALPDVLSSPTPYPALKLIEIGAPAKIHWKPYGKPI
jgi:uncharacterized protein YraI